MTDPQPTLPDYTGIVERAMVASNFGQLTAATYQAVNAIYANSAASPAEIAWIAANAGSAEAIDSTLKKFLCFVVVDPKLLPLNGELALAPVDLLEAVLITLVGNYVAAISRAQGAV
jgi:hypothetical protein